MKLIYLIALLAGPAYACDCTQPANYGNPECARQISAALTATQSQGQGQTQTARAGAVSGSTSTAAGGAGGSASVGNTSSVSAASVAPVANAATSGSTAASNVQESTSNTYVRAAANTVGLGTQIITGCGISGQAGGSNTRGSAILGVGFTTAECYAYIEAQAFHAIGDEYDACLVLHSTDAAKRTEKRLGHPLGACEPPAPVVEYRQPPGTWYNEEQLQARIADAVRAMAPCPVVKHAKHGPSPACKRGAP